MSDSPSQNKKEKILIIEGDGALGEDIQKTLISDGFGVVLVKNGTEGMKSIMNEMPHLIILDVTLPGVDGYDILNKKSNESLLAKIPVFLISSQGVPINMSRIPRGSVTEYVISLHIDPKDILRRVNRHFRYDAQSTNTEDAKPSESMKKKILWVEDDKLIGNILEKKLLNSGFNLYHATEGNDALKYLDGNIPDVIILDLLLPGMSGFDILQKIRTDMRLKKIPVIILSNFNKPSDIEKAKILGAQKYLVKAAISLDQIVEEVKELIK